jgi:antitoxin component YwqK of YwqJK toxin-antitoxin module
MKLILMSFAVFLSTTLFVFTENQVDGKKEHLCPGPWQQHLSDAVWMKELVKEDGIYRDKLSIVTSRRSGAKHLLAHTGWVKQEVRQFIGREGNVYTYKDMRVVVGKMILGKRQGLWSEWNQVGRKIAEGNYRDNIKQGLWTFWIQKTCWKTTGQMVEGKRQGLWAEWSQDGSKTSEGPYLNNQKEGLWTYHNLHGVEELRQTVQMVAGERQGLETKLWNGRKIEEGHYKDNEREGLWTTWNQEGQKGEARHYLKGVLDGPVAKWHKNGQKASEGHYKNGKLWTLVGWNPDGKKNETNLVDGNGIVIVPDWQEHRKYLYKDGKEVGGYKDGKLVMKKVYEMPAGGDEIVPRPPVVKVIKVIRDESMDELVQIKLGLSEITKHAYIVGYGKGKESGFPGGANPGTVRFIRLEYTGGDWDQDFGIGGDQNLLMEYHRRTGHKVAKMTESRRIMQLKNFPVGKGPPMVYMTGQRNITVTKNEDEVLREYLIDKGGMIFADNGGSLHWHGQFFNLMKRLLPMVRSVKIPLEHEIHQVPYRIPFLPLVAPHGGKDAYGWVVDNRLVAYYHPGDVGDAWADGHAGVSQKISELCYQLGTNVNFYAHAKYYKWDFPSGKSMAVGLSPSRKATTRAVKKVGIAPGKVSSEASTPTSPFSSPTDNLLDDLLDKPK